MEAIHLTKYGKPDEGLRLVKIVEPGGPKSSQMLIRVEYASINDSDLLVAGGLNASTRSFRALSGTRELGKSWPSVTEC